MSATGEGQSELVEPEGIVRREDADNWCGDPTNHAQGVGVNAVVGLRQLGVVIPPDAVIIAIQLQIILLFVPQLVEQVTTLRDAKAIAGLQLIVVVMQSGLILLPVILALGKGPGAGRWRIGRSEGRVAEQQSDANQDGCLGLHNLDSIPLKRLVFARVKENTNFIYSFPQAKNLNSSLK